MTDWWDTLLETVVSAFEGFLSNHNNNASAHSSLFNGKVDINQGTGNSGKFLKVNNGGNVTVEAVTVPTVVDSVTDGNSNAVSSNAVYDYIDEIIGDVDDWLTS